MSNAVVCFYFDAYLLCTVECTVICKQSEVDEIKYIARHPDFIAGKLLRHTSREISEH